MERCTRCFTEFVLFAAFGEVPAGLKLNGVPYCWECFEVVARELGPGAPSKASLLGGVSK